MDKSVKFHVDIINKYANDESQDFSIMQIQALSDGYNTHELEIANEVLLRDAQTVLGKPIVAKLSKDFYGKEDFKGHETDEVVIGYVPPNAEIRFPQKENGTFFEVDAVIFKLYSGNTLDIFKRDGIKSVSCEFSCSYGEDTPNVIDSFTIRGITILGSDDFGNQINPSCIGANARIVKFSEKDAENAYKTFMNKEVNMSQILEKLESIENKLQGKEEEMADLKDKDKETLSAEDKEKETDTEMAKKEDKEKMSQDTVEEKMQDDDADDKDDVDDKNEDEEKMSCGDKIKMEEIKIKLSQTETELAEKEKVIAEQLSELEQLRKFKTDTEMAKKESIVSETLSKIEKYVDEETLNKFKSSAESCKFSEITGWKNEALASITDKVIMSAYGEEGIMDMGLPTVTEVKTSIYD